jgi:hypothetical protein
MVLRDSWVVGVEGRPWRRAGKSDLERWFAPFIGALRHKTRARMCTVYVARLIGAAEAQELAAHGGAGWRKSH